MCSTLLAFNQHKKHTHTDREECLDGVSHQRTLRRSVSRHKTLKEHESRRIPTHTHIRHRVGLQIAKSETLGKAADILWGSFNLADEE